MNRHQFCNTNSGSNLDLPADSRERVLTIRWTPIHQEFSVAKMRKDFRTKQFLAKPSELMAVLQEFGEFITE
jgi:hypothetical protein